MKYARIPESGPKLKCEGCRAEWALMIWTSGSDSLRACQSCHYKLVDTYRRLSREHRERNRRQRMNALMRGEASFPMRGFKVTLWQLMAETKNKEDKPSN